MKIADMNAESLKTLKLHIGMIFHIVTTSNRL